MKVRPHIILLLSFACCFVNGHALGQGNEDRDFSNRRQVQDGWRLAAIPNISFDSDVGFRYGILASAYFTESGIDQTQPAHAFNLEWSRTSHGNGINRLTFNSLKLIPSLQLNWDISYLTDHELQFFGYNGYESVYNSSWEDQESEEYVSELFYRHDRKIFKINLDFKGDLFKAIKNLQWFAGLTYLDIEVGSSDIQSISKYRNVDQDLGEIEGLYEKYIKWGIIDAWEAKGDDITFLKGGLIYDSRNHKFFPTQGIVAEMIISYTPSLPGDGNLDFARASFFWKHFLSLESENLVFAYRLGYQGKIFGKVPFYLQPHIISSEDRVSFFQGLGGAKTLRGVMRNRVVGDGFFLGNAEIRWKFLNSALFNRELYLAMNLFVDVGQVVDKIDFDIDRQEVDPEEDLDDYFDFGRESLHLSGGTGLKAGFNKYFVLSMDYGVAMDKRDGNSGFHMSLNWLF